MHDNHSDKHSETICENGDGFTWEQRFDFFLKAVNDVSKALNEAAQSSKVLHRAIGNHNDLLTSVFWVIANHIMEEGECGPPDLENFILKTSKEDKEPHGKREDESEIPK